VLIEGRSGEGKSDLALRLIDRGATLVADDQVICQRRTACSAACAPAHRPGGSKCAAWALSRCPAWSAFPWTC
jgi:hypothetical protein